MSATAQQPWHTLLPYCREAAAEMEASFTVPRFMELRYDRLRVLYPHDPFTVGEATPDFFARTAAILEGRQSPFPGRSDPWKATSPEESHYADWLRGAMRTMTPKRAAMEALHQEMGTVKRRTITVTDANRPYLLRRLDDAFGPDRCEG